VLLVEDIVTTGGSVKEVKAALEERGAQVVAIAALADRSNGKADFGVPFIPLIEMNIPVYAPEECPLCHAGKPLVKPGRTGKK